MSEPVASTDFLGPDAKVGAACQKMLDSGKKITLRSIGLEINVAHTTLGRDAVRRSQIERAQALQKFADDLNGTRRGGLSHQASLELARAKTEIETLRDTNSLLIASHRATIMALGELGGMQAWLRFFERRTEIIDHLYKIGAMPDNVRHLKQPYVPCPIAQVQSFSDVPPRF